MGLGSFLKKAVGIVGNVASAVTGNPLFAIGGNLISGAGGDKDSGGGNTQGTAADPRSYINILYPGIDTGGTQTVEYPNFPELEGYQSGPLLPYSMPVLDAKMQGPTQGEMGTGRTLGMAEQTIYALLDPNNPFYKNQKSTQSQINKMGYLGNLRDMITQNRRERMMGRTGFLDPSREDENISRAILQNAQESELMADLQTKQNLGNFAQQMLSTAGQYNTLANQETQRRTAYKNDLITRLNMLRSDQVTRNSQLRSDAQNKYQVNNQNKMAAYEAAVSKLGSVIDLWNSNQNRSMPGIANARAAEASQQGMQQQQIGNLIQSAAPYLQQLFGGGTNAVLPWLNASGTGAAAGYTPSPYGY